MAQYVDALSMSWRVARAIRQDGWTGEVLAVHSRSCYLTSDASEIYALALQPLGNGPLHVVLPAASGHPFAGLAPGAAVTSNGTRLLLGDVLEVGLERAVLWDPKGYRRLGADPAALQRCLAELYRTAATRSPRRSLARLLPHLHEEDLPAALESVEHFPRSHALIGGLVESLARRNRRSLKVVASSLAGLGPGLTPAGDDFLAGMLLALALVREHHPDAELAELATLLLDTAAPRTHEISAAYLRSAHAGETSERWHPLLAALSTGDLEAVRAAAGAVMEAGETSGADMLAGFIAAMNAVHGGSPDLWQRAGAVLPRETLPPAGSLPPAG